nr:DNA replication complex GINS protein SLD5-like isoform X2 [Coffea arabica]
METGAQDGSSGYSTMDDYESLISTTDAELLKRAWQNEKAAPQILRFEAALIQRSREQIKLMMDLDRTIFLLRSYLRTRLQKIEKYVFHIQKTAELWNRLSRQEKRFAERCIEDMEKHLDQSVLSKLPSSYKSHLKQSSSSEEDDMVPEPRLDTYVICRSKRFLGAFQLDDSAEEPVNIEADDLYALPYKSIKPLVETGQIDLV